MATKKKLMFWTGGLLSFVLFVLLAIIGLVNWIVRPHGGGLQEVFLIGTRQLLMDVHVWLAVMFMVTIVIYLVFHWY